MGFDTSYILNKKVPVELTHSNVDLATIAKDIPFEKMKDFEIGSFQTSLVGAWDEGTNIHSTKMYFNPDWSNDTRWRVYYTAFKSGVPGKVGYAAISDPALTGWTTREISITAPFIDSAYGIGSLCLVKTPGWAEYLFKAYFQYLDTDTGKYETGYAESNDGDTFVNIKKVSLGSEFATYGLRSITSAIWDEQRKKIIATAHVSPYGAGADRFFGAILESTDGLNFKLVSRIDTNLGYDHAKNFAGDIIDLHWIVKLGSAYVILGTTSTIANSRTISVFYGVSMDLKNWYIPPYLAWAYSGYTTTYPLRYTTAVFANDSWHIAGIRGANTIGICKMLQTPPKKRIRIINADKSTTLSAGANEEVTITPSKGYSAKIKNVLFSVGAPTGGTAGTHTIEMYINESLYRVLYANYPYNVGIDIVNSFVTGATKQWPASNEALVTTLVNTIFTNENPLKIKYTNGTTGGAHNGGRLFRLVVEEELI